MMKPQAALIDGDILIHRVAAGAEEITAWDEDFWTLHSELEPAVERLDEWVAEIEKVAGVKKSRFALSDSSTPVFRKDVYPGYKANRKDARKPVCFSGLKAHAREAYDSFSKPGLEADDVLGIFQTRSIPGSTVIVTSDKDLLTIPGWHLDPLKLGDGMFWVSPEEAQRTHMVQTLTGDTTDNIPGCPGYGPKKSDRVVPESGASLVDMWEAVSDCFIKAGLTPDDALLNARLTRILHAEDFDFKTGKPILWEPPE